MLPPVAGIGSGGKGRADITGAAKAGADIVALCDVDEASAAAMFKTHAKAKRFADFRVMLEKMGTSIDACTISTPERKACWMSTVGTKLSSAGADGSGARPRHCAGSMATGVTRNPLNVSNG